MGTQDNILPICHAGSLGGPFKELNNVFAQLYPDVTIIDEPGGSASLVRDVIKGKECGILASADYALIPKLMFPDFTDWCLIFAGSEIVLRYSGISNCQDEINASNWYEILQRDGVNLWHLGADGDPGGYRALMVLQLAEKYYRIPGFYKKMMSGQNRKVISNQSDFQNSRFGYMLSYRLNMGQGDFKSIVLPDEINLSNDKMAEYYRQASVTITGHKPGEKVELYGEPIKFGLTIPRSFTNQGLALQWLKLLLSDSGRAILKRAGLIPLKPSVIKSSEMQAGELKIFSEILI